MSVAENAAGFSEVGLILGGKEVKKAPVMVAVGVTILPCVAWLFIQAVDQPLRLPAEFHQPASLKPFFCFVLF